MYSSGCYNDTMVHILLLLMQLNNNRITIQLLFSSIPNSAPGTEGWSEEKLQGIISRDAMIGARRKRREFDGFHSHGYPQNGWLI